MGGVLRDHPTPVSAGQREVSRSLTVVRAARSGSSAVRLLAGVLAVVCALAIGVPARAQDPVIVAFGDSLTAGFGVPQADAYPALLQERLQREGYAYRVVNAGVSGDTTAGGLRRVDWALKLKPEIVIVELGANDALRGQDLTSVRANLDQIVERFQAAGARVLVAGMRLPINYGPRYGSEFQRMFEDVAKKRKAAYMPFFLDGVGGNARLNQGDGIHPTAEGYKIIADRLWPYLKPLLVK
jgi:acyl-CoA thioesterase-1